MKHETQQQEAAIVRKVMWRIIPFTFLLYIVSYLDRANIGYAALQMNKELAISSEAFGFISGIFFIGYFLFEVPSNIALAKFGARRWIARILISWGVVAALTASHRAPNSCTYCASCSAWPRRASSPASSST